MKAIIPVAGAGTALIIVGRVLGAEDFRDSALYDANHVHVLRPERKAR